MSAPPVTVARHGPRAQAQAGVPARARAPRSVQTVVGWAGPWPLVERWWSDEPRARVHLQVSLDDGSALLLVCTAGAWTCDATYD